ncbi:MAG: DUF924 domain-containing protein [Deltaproteobacteria bacterium]|nr:DUF924 domain-containing protein [Deltaproteobacteria bacterium]
MEGPTVRRWFTVDARFDAELRASFGDDLEHAARGELGGWCASPRGALALIVLCDQIARNVHRGTARAFATDPIALHTTLLGLARGDHLALRVPERLFFLMPLMHSESLAVHDVARQEFGAVVAEAERSTPGMAGYAKGSLDYEDKHRVILARFGRYPHRNAALGRASTAEELEFLKQPGSSF